MKVGRAFQERGVSALDRPVSGGPVGVKNKTLAVMSGGPKETLDRAMPFLRSFTKTFVHVGPELGKAQIVKLANNILMATNMLIVAEAMAFAEKGGVDPKDLFEAVDNGSGRSWVSEIAYPKRRYDQNFRVELMNKDVSLCLQEAEKLGVPMWLGAAAMAKAGAHVTLVARSSAEIESLARAIERDGGRAEAATLDVTDIGRVERVLSSLEPFDILVNSAGTNQPAAFLDVTAEQYDTIMALNVRSLFFVSQVVARRMREAGRLGSIINISSQMGHVGAATRTVYCGSKWAIEGMTKAMAVDLAPFGIRVNTIGPTFIETPLSTRFLNDEAFKSHVLTKIKLGRIGQVEDVTGAIVFLASEASSLMTGSAVVIDGGWTAD
jgi:NAD(P)-dependent dehydrogenase (short-subunit alcohol dehydrogenase family)